MTLRNDTPASVAGEWLLGGDLPVARIGYGAMKLTSWGSRDARHPDRETALTVLRDAVKLGVNHIDTSFYYNRDGMAANELIRQALHPYPDDLVIVTKVGDMIEGGDGRIPPAERIGQTPDGLRRAIELNLNSLGVDRLDVVNLRMGASLAPVEESLAAPLETLAGLRDEGLIRHLGVSNVTATQVAQAREITEIACVQNRYSIGWRDDDALVYACAEAGIAFVPYFPVSHLDADRTARLSLVAKRHDISIPQLALAWLLARSPAMLVIPGTGSPAHLAENIAAGQITLTEADLAEIG